MTSVTIHSVTEWDALYCQYERQTEPQPCYIELDCQTGTLHASYNAEIGNAIPFSVYHGHDRRYGIPCLTADAANELMEEILPLAQRVVDGYSRHWDGNNHVARMTDDADAAEQEIEDIINALSVDETNGVTGRSAGDWMSGGDCPVTADMTDDELEAIASQLDDEAAEHHVVLSDTIEWLTERRQSLREEEDED